MTDAPLDPEQVEVVRRHIKEYQADGVSAIGTARVLADDADALCATVEHLRERLERAEEALREIRTLNPMDDGPADAAVHKAKRLADDALNRREVEDE